MKTYKFFEIPEFIPELEYDGQPTDTRLHHEDLISWYDEDEDGYNDVENMLDTKVIKTDKYEIYGGYDVSGYDYWVKQMDEENYICITVNFNENVELTMEEIEVLKKQVRDFYSDMKEYESYQSSQY